MENQHRKITGYRELSQEEINQMNHVKNIEAKLLDYMDGLLKSEEVPADHRWVAIARTNLQQGFMALGRAIARPDGYPVTNLGAEVRRMGLEGKGTSGS